MEAMTRQEWKREKRRLWWRKNEDKVIGAAMAPIALVVLVLLGLTTISDIKGLNYPAIPDGSNGRKYRTFLLC